MRRMQTRSTNPMLFALDLTVIIAAPFAGLFAGFITFATALGANIEADGNPNASATDLFWTMATVATLYLLPAIAVVVVARVRRLTFASNAFAACTATVMLGLTQLYGIATATCAAAVVALVASLRAGRPKLPPPDLTALLAVYLATALWCVLEAAR